MKFWRAREEVMPKRDVQAEAAEGVITAAKVLPAKRFIDLIYYTILDSRQVSTEDIDALANRLSRLAWERGRK
jgi:uncharacterized ferredoxin-like protein